MTDILQMIKETIEIIEETCSTDLIIYDNFGTFLNTEIKKLPQYNRWHLLPYCLRIKNNPSLYSKCKILKRRLLRKTDYTETVSKATCFCGVTEYNIPIKIKGKYVGLISITGFKGEIKEKYFKMYARHLKMTPQELLVFRERELVSTEKEKYVVTMLQILTHLFDEYIKQNATLFENNSTTNAYMIKALKYISLNYNKNITVSQVAKECYISVPYLQSLFSKFLGHGVSEEIRNQQINYAKELLSTTKHSVRQIAIEIGYVSPDYFCTVFKRETGLSPLNYRKRNLFYKQDV